MDRFKELGEKELFKNAHITVYSRKLQLPNEKVVDWTFTGKQDAVGVVAVLEGDNILLVKQYRPAVREVTVEIPAGLVEKGEDPSVAAIRELEEETGYKALNLEKICDYYMSPGVSEGRFHLYYSDKLIKTEQNLDEDEFLEVEEVALKDVNMSELSDAKSILAVEYAKRKRNIEWEWL